MKNKLMNKIIAMRNSEKRGMEILGWIATIAIGLAVVGIIWFFVRPTINNTADDATHGIGEDSSAIFNNASSNAQSGTTDQDVPTRKNR